MSVARYVGARYGERVIVSVVDPTSKCGSSLDPGHRFLQTGALGFDWGYTGAAPSQLAFAILLDHYNGTPGAPLLFYRDFAVNVVAAINTDHWELASVEVEDALERIRVLRSRAKGEKNWQQST